MLTDAEWKLLELIPVDDLVSLAAELDLIVPAVVERRSLLDACLPAIVSRARAGGLPFSKYDHDDLAALPPAHLEAIARLQGLSGAVTVRAVVRAGEKVYRRIQKEGRDSTLALLLPSLLTAVARTAAGG